jgi:putative NADH-flavin reductase
LDRGANVSVVSLDSKRRFEKIFKKDSEKITFQNLDLTDLDSCNAAVKNQDVVINLVGIKGNTGIGQTKVASFFIPMLRFQTNWSRCRQTLQRLGSRAAPLTASE